MAKVNRLTPKQEAFVREYLVDLNATQAAVRAGYAQKHAYEQGHENLRKPDIAAAIQAAMDKRAEKIEITADDVLRSIKRIRDKTEADDKYTEALKANELLGKHLKLFTDKHEHSGSLDVNLNILPDDINI